MVLKKSLLGLVAGVLVISLIGCSQESSKSSSNHADHARPDGQAAHTQAASGATTLKGEVIDLACYVGHGAKGPKHADCAKSCIESGIPAAILAEDGNLYVALGTNHQKADDLLAPHAGKVVSVTGKTSKKDGSYFIQVEGVI